VDSPTYSQILKTLRCRLTAALKCTEPEISHLTMAELLSLLFLLHGTFGSIGDFSTSFAALKKIVGTAIWDEPKPEAEAPVVVQ
jgi:hypothetical protein